MVQREGRTSGLHRYFLFATNLILQLYRQIFYLLKSPISMNLL